MNELTHGLAAFLLPPTGAFPLLLLGWWLRPRHAWAARAMFVLGLVSVWVGSTDFGAQWLQDRLLGRQSAFDLRRLAEVPAPQTAIVVLGAGGRVLVPEYHGSQLKTLSVERLRYGIWLARQCDCPLLMSGGPGRFPKPGQPSEAALADRLAREQFGFTPRWLEDRSADTRDNARFSAEMLKGQGIRRVVLVTHDVHMRRAIRAFRAELPQDIELVPAPIGLNPPGYEWRDVLPSQEGIARARYLGYEWLGWMAGH
ncbi:YdcF family protein [Roseateles amylovorans]|uniref:YdcF family protein n=1 Tax=Roseateles amylovorans TaxID=2978473 RepID=A0ABY6B658_9BURK|nr:YdcF family protein [Roseateles amylovorans]UXH80312.1 YdcF family protein [Roseateles amylovorans]